MLNSVEINNFQRIAYLKADLRDARVHLFCGNNEAGKSTLGEAIRFAIRGVSPRVKLKGDLIQLIHAGKKTGSVAIDLDGYPIHRNVRDAKATTKAMLDYPGLLVDIQLGGIEFAAAPEKDLRAMLNDLFKVGTPDEFIRARLAARDITEDMMNRTLPLIRASGFELASESATREQSRSRGEWEGITKETYGHVKARTWAPTILDEPSIAGSAIDECKTKIKELSARRDELNKKVGAISEAERLRNEVGGDTIESLRQAVADAEAVSTEKQTELNSSQEEFQNTTKDLQDQIAQLERNLDAARQEATALECPCCGGALTLTTTEGAAVLVVADETKKSGADVRAIAKALTDTKAVLTSHRSDQRRMVTELQAAYSDAITKLSAARGRLEKREEYDSRSEADDVDVETLAAEIATLDQEIESERARLQDMEENGFAREQAIKDRDRAATVAKTTAQWAAIAEALGNGPNGIPAELVASTTKPINTALAKLALPWDTSPVVMGNDMSVSRADGMPYYLLSKSAQFKANSMMQLALATVSALKVVVLDGFDILQPDSRGEFIDMLTEYTQRHPDVTVLALGTLKSKPMEAIDGLKFHWIHEGQLEAA